MYFAALPRWLHAAAEVSLSCGMNYLFVVPVAAYPISPDEFAMEGAFCDHLKVLLDLLSPPFENMVIAGLRMREETYERDRKYLGRLRRKEDRISFVPLAHVGDSLPQFWLKRYPEGITELYRLVKDAAVVHAGPSHNVLRPMEISALVMANALGKKTISVSDMDLRDEPRMMYQLGRWGPRGYLMSKLVYDPVRALQHHWVARACDLVLFKGEKLVHDYGRGRSQVRGIWDPGFHAHHIISQTEMDQKLATLLDPNHPLELVYFGRYVYYKGVDRCIDAVARALAGGDRKLHLNLIGSGEQEPALRARVRDLGIEAAVTFHDPIPYDDAFFAKLRPWHLMLAAPLGVDTPRSTWDSIASGLPILAFNTEFYSSLHEATGLVDVVPWPSTQDLAERIGYYADHRAELARMTRMTTRVAKENTQELWLERRVRWTRGILGLKD